MPEEISPPTERIARKIHTCNNCGGIIEPKEKYLVSTLKYMGSIYMWKDHIRCAALVTKAGDIFDSDWGEGIECIFAWEEGYLDDEDEKERIAIVELAQETRGAPYGQSATKGTQTI